MIRSVLHFRWLCAALLLAAFGIAASPSAWADPPSRVVRLAYINGAVSFSPAGEDEWVRAAVNRPLISGDRLWADVGSRVELRLGGSALRMGENTSVTLLNLDDRTTQLQVTQGILNLRVRRLDRDHVLEIDTPNLAYSVLRPGVYRVEVDPQGGWTQITLRSGEGEVFGQSGAFAVTQGQAYRFYGNDLRDYETYALAQPDEFDRWASLRDRRSESSASARYVSQDIIGYEDLDEYGHWRTVAEYGPVWTPDRVPAGWAPYRDGHWAWVEPWGWTWVDDAPWGFAPSHYGRWTRVDQSWAWVPGPMTSRPVYAPAVVQFVGGESRDSRTALTVAGIAAVAWFALAPHEVYRPSYQASREYLTAVNTSNTTNVTETHITNVVNNTNVTNIVYVNQQVSGAVVAVPTASFAQSKPVAKAALRVTNDAVMRAPVAAVAPVAPVKTSVTGAAPAISTKPPAETVARQVVAKTAPPPAPTPFAARQTLLATQAGKPLDAEAVGKLKPAAPQPMAPVVKVVTAAASAAPLPPKPASAAATAARSPQAPASTNLPAEPTAPERAGSAPATARAPSATAPVPPAASQAERTPRSATAVPRPPEPVRPAASAAAPPVPQATARPSVEAARPPTSVPSAPRAEQALRAAPPERPASAREVPRPPPRAVEPTPAPSPRAEAVPPPRAPATVPRSPVAEERSARAPAAVPRPPEAARPAASAVPPKPEATHASEPRRAASEARRPEKLGEEKK